MNGQRSPLQQRIITAIFFGCGLLIPLFLGRVPGLIVLGVLSVLTILEFLQLQELKGTPLITNTILAMIMYLGLTLMVLKNGTSISIKWSIYLSVAFMGLLLYRLYKREDPLQFSFKVIPATIYISIPIALLYVIANWQGPYFPEWILAILFFVWINDVLAYLFGRKIGKTPFSKAISPKKTWEGTIAGWIGCLIMAIPVSYSLGIIPLYQWLMLGLLIGITSSLGDLIESLYKRKKGIKDSGTFLPGHGGFLDRLDSLLFAMPFIALFFLICGPLK